MLSRPQIMGRVALLACVAAVTLTGCTAKPVAVVNGKAIAAEEFDAELREAYGAMVLNSIIERRLVDDALEAAGLTLDPAAVDEYLEDYYANAGGKDMALQMAAQEGQTEDDLRRTVEGYLKLEMIGQKDLSYTDEDLKAYYDENLPRYDEPEKVSFSRIMVMTEDEANAAYKKATAPDAKFADLAKELSVDGDQLKLTGGHVPAMDPMTIDDVAIRELLAKLEPGGVAKPIQSGGAWHVIKLDERIPGQKKTFEESREKVEKDYRTEHMVPFPDVMRELVRTARVNIEDPDFAELEMQYAGQALLDAAPSAADAGIPEPVIDSEPTEEAPAEESTDTGG